MERALLDKLPRGRFCNVNPVHRERMKAVRDRGNRSTEQRLRWALVRAGIRGWRLNVLNLPGKPDFYFPSNRVAVFVDGCFWHGCRKCSHQIRKNRSYWYDKIARNRRRDRRNRLALQRLDIKVLRFWEHDVCSRLQACVKNICSALATV